MVMVSLSSRGICWALTPVKSSIMRIMVGSSWPSMSSLRRLSSILVVVEVGGDDVGVRVVGGVLDGTEIVDLPVLRDNHHAAGVLAGGPA